MLLNLLVAVLAGYGLLIGLLYTQQRQILFKPDRNSPAHPADASDQLTDITSQTDDGLALAHWYLPPASSQGWRGRRPARQRRQPRRPIRQVPGPARLGLWPAARRLPRLRRQPGGTQRDRPDRRCAQLARLAGRAGRAGGAGGALRRIAGQRGGDRACRRTIRGRGRAGSPLHLDHRTGAAAVLVRPRPAAGARPVRQPRPDRAGRRPDPDPARRARMRPFRFTTVRRWRKQPGRTPTSCASPTATT